MSQKILKIGSSNGVTLKSDVLEAAGLKLGDRVNVFYDEAKGSIVVTSTELQDFTRNVAEARQAVERYRDELLKIEQE